MPPKAGHKSGTKWGPEAEAALFNCFLKVHETKVNYNELAKEMNAIGYECTPKALTHRISTIKNKVIPAPADTNVANPIINPYAPTTKPSVTAKKDESTTPSPISGPMKPKVKKAAASAEAAKKRKEGVVDFMSTEDEPMTDDVGKMIGKMGQGKKVKVEDVSDADDEGNRFKGGE